MSTGICGRVLVGRIESVSTLDCWLEMMCCSCSSESACEVLAMMGEQDMIRLIHSQNRCFCGGRWVHKESWSAFCAWEWARGRSRREWHEELPAQRPGRDVQR